MNEMDVRVQEYLKSDRQWTRPMRLAHAKMELSKATTDQDKEFWQIIVKANSRGE